MKKSTYIGIIEVNDSVFYITREGNKLKAGTCCNSGIIPHYEVDIDDCFSIDENLQELIEVVNEGEGVLN